MVEQSTLSAVLKRYRIAASLSQEALAARAGLSARAISDLERGLHRAARSSTLDLLATALALTTQQRAVLLAAARPRLTEVPISMRRPQTLPAAPTALLGRDRERRQAQSALGASQSQSRLLTVSGPSGVGKTRLALQVAEDLASAFRDGAVFIDLAPIRDTALLFDTLAQALGLREQPSIPSDELVLARLENQRMLLVLDNFEHLLDAAPRVAELLARCPHVSVLVTSRALLRLRGEQRLMLQPLAPDAAVALFRARAQALRPDQELPQDVVMAICERVDRLPLAIELAATRARILPLPQLLDHLTHRLALLRDGAREAPSRQRTMEAAIAWSYDLLNDQQQRCFRTLGAFVGGWTLEAAQAVCWDEDSRETADALLMLAALVDASLIQADEMAAGTVRFRMLELIRDYALARLDEAPEAYACHLRHAQYFARLGDTITHTGPGRAPNSADDPASELPNARAALEWAEQVEEAALGMRLAGFGRLWHVSGQMHEAIQWQERMLALDDRTPRREGDTSRAIARAERLYCLGRTLLGIGEYDRAEAHASAALDLAQLIGDDDVTSNALMTIGMIAHARGDFDKAASAFALAYDRISAADPTGQRRRVKSLLADTERRRGNLTQAAALLEQAVADAEAKGNTWDTARMATMKGMVALQQQRYTEATRSFVQALTLFRPFGSPGFSAWCLEGFAAVCSAQDAQVWVTRLCAAASNLRAQAHAPAPAAEREAVDGMLTAARAQLGERVFVDIWQEGLALSVDDAIGIALAKGLRQIDSDERVGLKR